MSNEVHTAALMPSDIYSIWHEESMQKRKTHATRKNMMNQCGDKCRGGTTQAAHKGQYANNPLPALLNTRRRFYGKIIGELWWKKLVCAKFSDNVSQTYVHNISIFFILHIFQ